MRPCLHFASTSALGKLTLGRLHFRGCVQTELQQKVSSDSSPSELTSTSTPPGLFIEQLLHSRLLLMIVYIGWISEKLQVKAVLLWQLSSNGTSANYFLNCCCTAGPHLFGKSQTTLFFYSSLIWSQWWTLVTKILTGFKEITEETRGSTASLKLFSKSFYKCSIWCECFSVHLGHRLDTMPRMLNKKHSSRLYFLRKLNPCGWVTSWGLKTDT